MGRRIVKPASAAKKPAWPRLLLAVDFSPASRLAFDAARALAKDLGAGIVLLHVTPKVLRRDPQPGRKGPYLTPPEAAVQDAITLSAKWAEELRKDDVFVKSLDLVGPPAQTIVDVARKHGCNAIVLATHGRSAIKALMVGSVAREVLRTSPLPTLMVPTRTKARRGKAAEAAPPAKAIVCAVDFSDESELAFQASLALAHDLKCLVRAVHVVPLPASLFPLGAEYAVPALEEDEESSAEQLALMASRARRQKVGVVPSVQVGHAATAILAEAKATGAALIVMGTHGRSAARRFFLGSVAQDVVQSADRPVLVVPGNVPARGAWRR